MNKPYPNTLHRLLSLSSLISILIATAACAEDPMSNANPNPKAAIKAGINTQAKTTAEPASSALWRQIQAEVGDAECDGPQQCYSIAVGAKDCGGPDGYLAWSSKSTDAKKLRSLIEQHVAARKAENLASDMRSDCRMVTDPGATCRAGKCVLNANGGGSSAY